MTKPTSITIMISEFTTTIASITIPTTPSIVSSTLSKTSIVQDVSKQQIQSLSEPGKVYTSLTFPSATI